MIKNLFKWPYVIATAMAIAFVVLAIATNL